MKYLFFDIECSNCFGGVGKMCEFGYVLCDEELHVIKATEIPMSPGKGKENRFYLKGRKHEKDLELAYDYDYYFDQPEFTAFYGTIKKLMEDPDTICFAFSMDNDIPHLYHACKRYKLEPLNFKCYDVQKIAESYLEINKQISLGKACKEIVGPNSLVVLQEHLSRDDAMMEMFILEAISVLTKTDVKELLRQHEYASAYSKEYMEKYLDRIKAKKNKEIGHKLFRSVMINDDELEKDDYKGRRFIFSGSLKSEAQSLKKAIAIVSEKGGVFTNRIAHSDFFVVLDSDDKENIIQKLKEPYQGIFVLYEDLWTLRVPRK